MYPFKVSTGRGLELGPRSGKYGIDRSPLLAMVKSCATKLANRNTLAGLSVAGVTAMTRRGQRLRHRPHAMTPRDANDANDALTTLHVARGLS